MIKFELRLLRPLHVIKCLHGGHLASPSRPKQPNTPQSIVANRSQYYQIPLTPWTQILTQYIASWMQSLLTKMENQDDLFSRLPLYWAKKYPKGDASVQIITAILRNRFGLSALSINKALLTRQEAQQMNFEKGRKQKEIVDSNKNKPSYSKPSLIDLFKSLIQQDDEIPEHMKEAGRHYGQYVGLENYICSYFLILQDILDTSSLEMILTKTSVIPQIQQKMEECMISAVQQLSKQSNCKIKLVEKLLQKFMPQQTPLIEKPEIQQRSGSQPQQDIDRDIGEEHDSNNPTYLHKCEQSDDKVDLEFPSVKFPDQMPSTSESQMNFIEETTFLERKNNGIYDMGCTFNDID